MMILEVKFKSQNFTAAFFSQATAGVYFLHPPLPCWSCRIVPNSTTWRDFIVVLNIGHRASPLTHHTEIAGQTRIRTYTQQVLSLKSSVEKNGEWSSVNEKEVQFDQRLFGGIWTGYRVGLVQSGTALAEAVVPERKTGVAANQFG